MEIHGYEQDRHLKIWQLDKLAKWKTVGFFFFTHKPLAPSDTFGLILFTDGVFKEHCTHQQAAGGLAVPEFHGGTSSYAAQHVDPAGSWE